MQLGSDFLLHFLTTLHVSDASCVHHQEYDDCICSLRHELHIGQPPSYVAELELVPEAAYTVVIVMMMDARGVRNM